jgi:hypothetical protein
MRDGLVTYETLRSTVARAHHLPHTAEMIGRLRDRLAEGPIFTQEPPA